jgi:hypothetical protein
MSDSEREKPEQIIPGKESMDKQRQRYVNKAEFQVKEKR